MARNGNIINSLLRLKKLSNINCIRGSTCEFSPHLQRFSSKYGAERSGSSEVSPGYPQLLRCFSISAAASSTQAVDQSNAGTLAAAGVNLQNVESMVVEPPAKQSLFWKVFKTLAGTSILMAGSGIGYVTYQYETDFLQSKLTEAKEGVDAGDGVQGPVEKIYKQSVNGVFDIAQAYLDTRKNVEEQIKGWSAPSSDKLLPDLLPHEKNTITLVLDLGDTLVHSDWKRERGWRTFKRPGVDAFLEHMAHYYEVVVFSDQLNITVDPILDRLDRKGCIRFRLYRDATQYDKGQYFRDLSKLNRDPRKVLYLTGHPENSLHKENVVPIKAWNVSETDDTALLDLLPFLEYLGKHKPADVRAVLASYEGQEIPKEFKERGKEVLRRQQERQKQGIFRTFRS